MCCLRVCPRLSTVIYTGLMGAGIAEVSANRGLGVLLKDVDHAALGRGTAQIASGLDAKVKRRVFCCLDCLLRE